MIKLSIIVPVYNVERYIEKCVNSIMNQTFKEFELILVDDGSTDSCGVICDKYANLDPRVKVIHKKNGGLSSARNVGIKMSSAKYIAFVDSDDWIDEKMYEIMYKIMEKNENIDIVQCGYIDAESEDIEIETNYNSIEFEVMDKKLALKNIYGLNAKENVVAWNKIYKYHLFNEISFPEGKIHEDMFTTHRLLYKSNQVAFINEKLYFYRKTPNSITNSKFNVKKLDLLEAFKDRMIFFKNIDEYELYSQSLLSYMNYLKEFYFKSKKELENKRIAKNIQLEHRKFLKIFLKNKRVSIKNKIINTLFFISPNIIKGINIIKKIN